MREPEDWDKQEYRIPRLFLLLILNAKVGITVALYAYGKNITKFY